MLRGAGNMKEINNKEIKTAKRLNDALQLLRDAKCSNHNCDNGIIYELSRLGCQEPKQCRWCCDKIKILG